MSRASETDNTTRIVLIVVGSVVGVGLLVALLCGGFFFLTTYVFVKSAGRVVDQVTDSLEAITAAQTFAADLSANQFQQAYDSTTRGYRDRHTLEQMRAYFDLHPTMKQPGNFTQPQGAPWIKDHYAVRLIYNNNQATSATFNVIKEDGRWKVDDFTMP
jgi:hypothetical protein